MVTHLDVRPLDTPHRPSVDVAVPIGRRRLRRAACSGIVMTGMGSDGREGAAWIKAKGGTVLTEAEETCVVYGMPRSIVEAGLSDGSVDARSHGRRDAGARVSGERCCSSTTRPGAPQRAADSRGGRLRGRRSRRRHDRARAVLPREAGPRPAGSRDEGHERPRCAEEAARARRGRRASSSCPPTCRTRRAQMAEAAGAAGFLNKPVDRAASAERGARSAGDGHAAWS